MNDDLTISISNEITKEISDWLDVEYDKYESDNGVQCNFKQFSIIAKDHEKLIGVLNGYTAFSEIYVDDLLVIPTHRSQGIGKKLLHYLEEHFKNQSFTNINLVTNEFQAPEFYKKCVFCYY